MCVCGSTYDDEGDGDGNGDSDGDGDGDGEDDESMRARQDPIIMPIARFSSFFFIFLIF